MNITPPPDTADQAVDILYMNSQGSHRADRAVADICSKMALNTPKKIAEK